MESKQAKSASNPFKNAGVDLGAGWAPDRPQIDPKQPRPDLGQPENAVTVVVATSIDRRVRFEEFVLGSSLVLLRFL